MNRQRRRRQAFTLLELMIVLVILVLLIAMVGPRLLGSQKKADIKLTTIQLGAFKSALQDYFLDMRTFPATEDGLQALLEPPSDEQAARKWNGPYLDDDVLPRDPWDNDYQYEYPPTKNRELPDIWSLGPDGEADTDDDIVNWRKDGAEAGVDEGMGDSGSMNERPSSGGSGSSGGSRSSGSSGGGLDG